VYLAQIGQKHECDLGSLQQIGTTLSEYDISTGSAPGFALCDVRSFQQDPLVHLKAHRVSRHKENISNREHVSKVLIKLHQHFLPGSTLRSISSVREESMYQTW
jgi:hypothetical protein